MPDEIQGTARAFMESRVLLSALELDLFTAVAGGATVAEVAAARANPSLEAVILDLATVLPIATGHVAEAGPVPPWSPAAGS